MIKILIINPFGIGDVIFSTPLIASLKRSFPAIRIGYICNERASQILSASPSVDKIFVYEKDDYRDIWKRSKKEWIKKLSGFLDDIRKEKFDVSIDLSLSYQYSMFCMFIGIPRRIGFNYRGRGRFLTSKVDVKDFDDKHIIEYYLDMLKPLDLKTCGIATPNISVSASDMEWADKILSRGGITESDSAVGIICGGGASWGVDAGRKRWDKNKFASLTDKLIDSYGVKAVFLGDKNDAALVKDVRSVMKNAALDLSGETTVGQMAAVMKRCRVIITNDGGPLHMGVGLDVNTVSIFGPVDEKTYGPYPESGKHIVISRKDIKCRPCYKKFKYNKCDDRICLDSISVDDVYAAAERLLKR